jgi:ABC-type multidrug transport system ATPase subunit
MAGLRPADSGSVAYDGVDSATSYALRGSLGFVPQDDIILVELPLVSTLRYAARLRLPPSTSAKSVDELVNDALEASICPPGATCASVRSAEVHASVRASPSSC